MTWPRYLAITRATQPNIIKAAAQRGDFADLVNFLGADPTTGRSAILK